MTERTYIIRIYRLEKRDGEARRAHDRLALAGTVENADGSRRLGFNDIEQLWEILAKTRRTRAARTFKGKAPP